MLAQPKRLSHPIRSNYREKRDSRLPGIAPGRKCEARVCSEVPEAGCPATHSTFVWARWVACECIWPCAAHISSIISGFIIPEKDHTIFPVAVEFDRGWKKDTE